MSETVRKIEEETHEKGVSYLDMMENAAEAVCKAIKELTCVVGKNVAVVVSSGNNGGDGYAVARLLSNEGAFVKVLFLDEPTSYTAIQMKEKFYGEAVPFNKQELFSADIIIDGIFGIGFRGTLEGKYKEAVEVMNSTNALKVAIDVPSGLIADSGKEQFCFKADLTVTFIGYKLCHLLYPAASFCGRVVADSIKIEITEECVGEIIKTPVLSKRKSNTHKGTYGTAAFFCGSYSMTGAAVLSLRGALRMGLGIANAVVQKEIYPIITSCVTEAVCTVYEKGDLSFVKDCVNSSRATLIGCGLSVNDESRKLFKEVIKECKNSLVIDADGLNILAEDIECIKHSRADIVLTPHPGEMARLMKKSVSEIESDRIYYAKKLAVEYGCTVVLKGNVTVVASKDGEIYFNLTGNAGMATGGSGDVLAGMITSLCAQGESGLDAALKAVFLHGAAGDKVKEKLGEISLLPSDMIECLPEVLKSIGE